MLLLLKFFMKKYNMRACVFFICGFFIAGCKSNLEEKGHTISIPFTIVDGYGGFIPSFGWLSPKDEKSGWAKTYESPKGVPKDWYNITQSHIWLDTYQFVYQHHKEGNIDKEMYKFLQESWKWNPDTLQLSSTPIKCFVYVVSGRDKNGYQWVKVDTNNNLDFSDDEAFEPEKLIFGQNEFSTKNLQKVQYERFVAGEIVDVEIPLVIRTLPDGKLGYCFPQYGKCELGKSTILFPRGSPTFEACGIVEADEKSNKTFEDADFVKIDKYLTLGGILGNKYKNKGVDFYTQTLKLETAFGDTIQSFQKGYLLEPFSGNDFLTGKEIRTNSYKGKYLYLDFWGTWCRGCVADMPELVSLYQGLDKNKVEFIGIATGEQSLETLRGFLGKHNVKWPQVLSTDQNNLAERYKVASFPTTALIDPTGKIVQMNIRPHQLKEILAKELK